jgi:hypothetical protein
MANRREPQQALAAKAVINVADVSEPKLYFYNNNQKFPSFGAGPQGPRMFTSASIAEGVQTCLH